MKYEVTITARIDRQPAKLGFFLFKADNITQAVAKAIDFKKAMGESNPNASRLVINLRELSVD